MPKTETRMTQSLVEIKMLYSGLMKIIATVKDTSNT